jgi:cytoskeletal protein CcmA (bactofilin family)
MPVKFTNNSSTTLSADIAADATSVTVESVTGFPSVANTDFFFATLEREADANTKEVVKVTALSTKTYTIDRSISTSATFSAGDKFEVRMTAEGLQDPSLLQAGITTNTLTVDAGSGDTEGAIHSSTGSARLFIDTDATSGSKYASIEMGGTDGSFIDIKKPATDDYDLRIQHFNDAQSVITSKTGDMVIQAQTNGTAVKLQHEGANTKLETTDTGIDVTGEVKGDSLDIDGNAAITGTVTIDPPLVTSVAGGLGAKGIIMKQGDLRMKVDGDYDADDSTDSKGGSSQNNSRIIFDSEQHEHVQSEGLGYQNPAFVIQANYNHNADNATHGTTAGEEYLDANISQLGLGNLTISSGKLQLRGKLTGADDGSLSNDGAASDGFFGHESFIGLSIDGAATNGTLTNLHFGRINDSTQNIRLQPSAGGIIVEGMGTAGSPTASKSNSGTIGTFDDEDLITLAQNQVTVAGELEATSLDINGAVDVDTGGAAYNINTGSANVKFTSTDTSGQFIIENSTDDANGAPDLHLQRTSGTPADGDVVGSLVAEGKAVNSDGTLSGYVYYSRFLTTLTDSGGTVGNSGASDGAYAAKLDIQVSKAGAPSATIQSLTPDLVTFNKPIDVTGEIKGDSLDIDGAADISGDLTLSAGGDGALTFGAASSIKVIDNSATALVIEEANTAYMTFNTANSGGEKIEFGKPIHGTLTGDVTGNVTGNVSGTALTVTQAAQTAITSVGSLTGLTMAATSASVGGKILFKEGTDNGTNSVTLQGPASTADVTVTLPTSAGTLALTSDIGFVAPTTVVGSAAIDDMTSNISKKYVHTGGAVTLKFPNVTASSNLGDTWVVVNAGTDTLTFDRVSASQFKKLNGSTVASLANTVTLSEGGVAELTVTADNQIIIFGSGVI